MSGLTATPTAPTSAPPVISKRSKQIRKWILPLALGLSLLLIPAPTGLNPAAWHYFALFAAVVAALITEPLPGARLSDSSELLSPQR